jgi:hypothetical protein
MKAFLDMPVSRSLLRTLEAYEHEGVHAYDIGLGQALSRVLQEVSPEQLERSICVVDRRRIRLTRLPIRDKRQ